LLVKLKTDEVVVYGFVVVHPVAALEISRRQVVPAHRYQDVIKLISSIVHGLS
jgi:hypothetical protein